MKKIFFMLFVLVLLNLTFILSLDIKINSPNTSKVFNSTRLMFNITTDNSSLKGDFSYSYDENPFASIKMCNKAKECVNNIRFNDGPNVLVFRFSDVYGNSAKKEVNISIDSAKPKINSFYKLDKIISNNSKFLINYSESDLENIILYYGRLKNIKNISKSKTECFNGTGVVCDFTNSLNLSGFDGYPISFWYDISDKANTISSSKKIVEVDLTHPKIISSSANPQGLSRVRFVFEIQERNFDEISYLDESTCEVNVTSGILCSEIRQGICVNVKKFCNGDHKLNITVSDKAGNINKTMLNFTVF